MLFLNSDGASGGVTQFLRVVSVLPGLPPIGVHENNRTEKPLMVSKALM